MSNLCKRKQEFLTSQLNQRVGPEVHMTRLIFKKTGLTGQRCNWNESLTNNVAAGVANVFRGQFSKAKPEEYVNELRQ